MTSPTGATTASPPPPPLPGPSTNPVLPPPAHPETAATPPPPLPGPSTNPVLPPPAHPETAATPPPPPSFDDYLPPPPRPRPTLPSLSPMQVAGLLAAAVLTNLALRSEVSVLSGTLAALLIAGPILGSRIRASVMSSTFVCAAVVFALWLPVRASSWLTWLNATAIVGFLIAAAATAAPVHLRLGTSTVATLVSRALQSRFFLGVLSVTVMPFRSLRAERWIPIIRGILIAAIPVGVLAALLASADAVFADSLSTDVDPSSWISHSVLTIFAAAAIAGLVAMLAAQPDEHYEDRRPLGGTEALILLTSVGVLYAGFALVQLLSALGRSDQILQDQGMSFAEYARSGFFQLLWVAGLTVVLLTTVRMLVVGGSSYLDRAVRIAGAAVAMLTTLIVATAIVRLGLYTDEFGQTTLRWYCTAFAWMLGIAFVLIAVGHSRRAEAALPAALIALVATTLFAVNMLNPEARVVEHNLGRADVRVALDADYLTRLSADAWPALLASDELVRSQLPVGNSFDARCEAAASSRDYGPFGFNLAVAKLSCS